MPRHYPVDDLLGQVYGRLTVKEKVRIGPQKWGWRCECECGGEARVSTYQLKVGSYTSCGCLKRELNRSGARAKTHGMSKTRVHRIWRNMKTRCENPNFPRYCDHGGRGIKVCERWQTFENFLADMGEPPSDKHSIDRIDNDGDYCKENCRWATGAQQGRNKRNNRILEFNGESRPVSEWAELLGIHVQTILYRLRAGWPAEKALSVPPDPWASRRMGLGEDDRGGLAVGTITAPRGRC